jgi:hypothetical protein
MNEEMLMRSCEARDRWTTSNGVGNRHGGVMGVVDQVRNVADGAGTWTGCPESCCPPSPAGSPWRKSW